MKKILLVALVFLVSCAPKEPEGPVEAIGKGIDQIARGLEAMTPEEKAQRNRYDDRFDDRYRDDDYYRDRDDRYLSDDEYCRAYPERCRDRYRY